MMKKIMLIILLLFISVNAGAVEFDETHTGRYCKACHLFGPCSDSCHRDSDEPRSYVGPQHVNPGICSRCHGDNAANPDIHSVHEKKICSTCHSSKGWNSSIAKIPPSSSVDDGIVMLKNKQCKDCHSLGNANRLHGLHTSFLTEEYCEKCHGNVNPNRAEILRVTGREPNPGPGSIDAVIPSEIKDVFMTPVNIITDFFNSIAKVWMEILT